jgi:AcrR family transcriptional regulator
VLVPGPPEEATVAGAVRDLAARLGVRDLPLPRIDDLLERVLTGGVNRLVVLFDEADQYVSRGGAGGGEAAFARSWFNKLEVTRKQYDTLFDLVFAGGLGLFYLEREIGSGIVSRAEPCVLSPFDAGEIAEMAAPFAEAGRALDDASLETLRALSGGSPALVTYGLQNLWERSGAAAQALEQVFGLFRERHDSFVRAVHASVSESGRLDAPWRVLEVVRGEAGSVPMPRLRAACVPRPGERVNIDPVQALKLLSAAGLVRIDGGSTGPCLRIR